MTGSILGSGSGDNQGVAPATSTSNVQNASTDNANAAAVALGSLLSTMTQNTDFSTQDKQQDEQPSGEQSSGGESSGGIDAVGDQPRGGGGSQGGTDSGDTGGQGRGGSQESSAPLSSSSEKPGVSGEGSPAADSAQPSLLQEKQSPLSAQAGPTSGPSLAAQAIASTSEASQAQASASSTTYSSWAEGAGGYTQGFYNADINASLVANMYYMTEMQDTSEASLVGAEAGANATTEAGSEAAKQLQGQAMMSFCDGATSMLGPMVGWGMNKMPGGGEASLDSQAAALQDQTNQSTAKVNSLNTSKNTLQEKPMGSAHRADPGTFDNEKDPPAQKPAGSAATNTLPGEGSDFTSDEKNQALDQGYVSTPAGGNTAESQTKFNKITQSMKDGGYDADLKDVQTKSSYYKNANYEPKLGVTTSTEDRTQAQANSQSIGQLKPTPPPAQQYSSDERTEGLKNGYISKKDPDTGAALSPLQVDENKTLALYSDLGKSGHVSDQANMKAMYANAPEPASGQANPLLSDPGSQPRSNDPMADNHATHRSTDINGTSNNPKGIYSTDEELEFKRTGTIKDDPDGSKREAIVKDMRASGYHDNLSDLKTTTNTAFDSEVKHNAELKGQASVISNKQYANTTMFTALLAGIGKVFDGFVLSADMAPAKLKESRDQANAQLDNSAVQMDQSTFSSAQQGQSNAMSNVSSMSQIQSSINASKPA